MTQKYSSLSKGLSWLAMSGCAVHLGGCISVSSEYEQGVVESTLNASPVRANVPTMQALQPVLAQSPVQRHEEWWLGFQDPVLNELVGYARRNANNIKSAINQIDRAEIAFYQVSRNHKPDAQFQASQQAQFPEINREFGTSDLILDANGQPIIDANGNPLRSDPAIFNEIDIGPLVSRDLSLSLSWQPDLYGALKAARQAAEQDILASQASLENAQRLIIGQVLVQYMSLRASQTTIAFGQMRLEAQREQEKVMNYLLEEGFATKFEAQAVKSAIVQTELQISNAQTTAIAAVNTMFALVGANDLQRFSARLWQEQDLPILPPIPRQIDPVHLIAARPDLKVAEYQLRAAAERVFAAKGQLLPTFSLTGSLTFDPFELFRGDYIDAFTLGVGGNLSHTLLNRNELKAALLTQDNTLRSAALTYEQTVRTIVSEVDTALSARFAAEQQLRAIEKSRQSSEENFKDATALFEAGFSGREFVYNADISRLDAVSQQYAAYFTVLQAHINYMTNTVF